MDSRDWLILGGVAAAGWIGWRAYRLGSLSEALGITGNVTASLGPPLGPPSGSASMTRDAAGTTVHASGYVDGGIFGGLTTILTAARIPTLPSNSVAADLRRATATVRQLLPLNGAPQPVAPAPIVKSVTTLGTSPVLGSRPGATPGILPALAGLR
jgi:hypothetical protein